MAAVAGHFSALVPFNRFVRSGKTTLAGPGTRGEMPQGGPACGGSLMTERIQAPACNGTQLSVAEINAAARRPVGEKSGARYQAASVDCSAAILIGLVGAQFVPVSDPLVKGLSVYAIYLLYFALFEGFLGATPGKWYFNLRVVGPDGRLCGMKRGILRTLGRVIDANPLILGGTPAALLIWFTQRRQHVGDFIAGTVVLHSADVIA